MAWVLHGGNQFARVPIAFEGFWWLVDSVTGA
jgi:hypothetical protein